MFIKKRSRNHEMILEGARNSSSSNSNTINSITDPHDPSKDPNKCGTTGEEQGSPEQYLA
ncbi:MAG: hypothetical protein MHMPM18_004043, partial [Marteilia pararefringens]